MEENKELNLNDSSKNKIKTDRKINSKNLIKAIVILVGFIVVVAMSISFFFGGDKKEEVKEEEIGFQEKNVGELEEKNYGNSRVQEAIEEKINEEEIIEENYEPERTETAEEEIDPYEEFMKEMELDKLKRHYEAKKSPFNSSSKKISSDSSSSLEAMKYDNPDAAKYGSSYGNSSEYMNYITAGIGGSENPNMQKEKKAWLKNAAINNFILQKPLIPSISKYEVKAGTYIPITLIPSINSDIPGTFS
ncbi:MAG: conjugal transfer protein TrbI, partial [Fusobacterium sp.]|nr:conjugal transfer protein TrbI [Fusobacterium sp.]